MRDDVVVEEAHEFSVKLSARLELNVQFAGLRPTSTTEGGSGQIAC